MFVYWPWLALMAVLVLISAVVVLKVGRQICMARTTVLPPRQTDTFQPEEADIELAMSQGGWDHQDDYVEQHHHEDYNDLQYGQDQMDQIDYSRPPTHTREISL